MALSPKLAAIAKEIEAQISATLDENLLGKPFDPRRARQLLPPQEITADGVEYIVEQESVTFDEASGTVHADMRLRPKNPMLVMTVKIEDPPIEFPRVPEDGPAGLIVAEYPDRDARWRGYQGR